MEVYILQENYSYTCYDAGLDENGSYDEDIENHDVIGVFDTLDDAVRKLVETCRMSKEYGLSGEKYCDYDILVGDTETNQVKDVLLKEYQELLVKISCVE